MNTAPTADTAGNQGAISMSRRSVLMLGEDAHAAAACFDLDIDLTIVCGHSQRDFGLADGPIRRIFTREPDQPTAVLAALYHNGIEPTAFDAVYTSDEGAVSTAAVLAALLRAGRPPAHAGLLFRDKALAKRAVGRTMRTARYEVLDDLPNLPADYVLPYRRAVLKPIDSSATFRSALVDRSETLHAHAARARAEQWSDVFILEEFIDGEEWHIDGVMHDGRLLFAAVGRYEQTCLTAITGREPLRLHLFDPVDDAKAYEQALPLAERALGVLGMESGVFHMEVFHDETTGELTFGECAARRGGGLTEEEVFFKFGISLSSAAVQCALGERPVIEPDVRPGVVGYVHLPTKPGTLVSQPTVQALATLPDVVFAVLEYPLGYRMEPIVSTQMKMGQVMLCSPTRDILLKRIDEVVTWFTERVTVIPNNTAVMRLRSRQASIPSPAALEGS